MHRVFSKKNCFLQHIANVVQQHLLFQSYLHLVILCTLLERHLVFQNLFASFYVILFSD